ncbi:MAG: hypothetical protein ACJ8F3_21155 [Xanthobacteraceae bacterium]
MRTALLIQLSDSLRARRMETTSADISGWPASRERFGPATRHIEVPAALA